MTGYGKGEFENCKVEIRALNHRFCEISIKRLPSLLFFEEEIKKIIKRKVKRGRIDVLVSLPYGENSSDYSNYEKIDIDKDMVYMYKKAAERLSKILNKKDDLKLNFFLNLPGILKIRKKEINEKKIFNNIKHALYQALEKLELMRKKEGKIIGNDFNKRVKKINFYLSEIESSLPQTLRKYENKLLMDKLRDFLKEPKKKNEKQLLRVSIAAERMEVTEEVVRFKSHLKQFSATFKGGNEIGKKLDFIIQEMIREITTVGAKINDYKISCKVIQIKSELEKLKEQVQNIV